MKLALSLLLLAFPLFPSCQSTGSGIAPNSRVILEDVGVRVLADARQRGREWTIRGIDAQMLAGGGLRELRVTVFDDKNGDGKRGGGERLGIWHVQSSASSQHMAVSGHVSWLAAEDREALQRLRVETQVVFSDGTNASANEPVFE